MTIGERLAWIWVWAAMVVVSATAAVLAWGYWSPISYLNAMTCTSQNEDVAAPACERALSSQRASVWVKSTALRRLANIAEKSGKTDVAIERLTSLIQLDAATPEDWNTRGLNYFAQRDYGKAADDFRQAAALKSVEGVYWANLAAAQVEAGKFSDALQSYTTAMQNGSDTAEVRGNRGWANYQLGEYEEALKDYDSAITMDPKHADNINERGLVRHALEDYEGALTDYTRSLSLIPDRAVVLTNRAITHVNTGSIKEAQQDLDRAISLDPDYPPAHLEKAWLLIDDNDPERALLEVQAIERIVPLGTGALEARGRIGLALGDWAGVIADADRALALGTTGNWPYEFRARAKRALGDYEGSLADIDVVLKRSPASMRALVIRAISLQLTGRSDEALAVMDQAIKENIDPAYAYEIRSYINSRVAS